MNLYEWAARWGVSLDAVTDLMREFRLRDTVLEPYQPGRVNPNTEGAVQATVRLEAAKKGLRIWRNNVGAMQDTNGRHVRFGLANDSERVNAHIKSADLIGIRPVTITAAHVGHTIGQFVSREIKPPGWSYSGTPREEAQKRWAELIAGFGGDAQFANSEGTL